MKKVRIAFFLGMLIILSCTTSEKKNKNEPSGHQHRVFDGDMNNYVDQVNSGKIKTDTLKGSPERVAMALIDGCHVHIVYGSPGVRGRIIWGGLVPFDQLWVTGAHQATNISFNRDIKINDKELRAGEYALFTIPGRKQWTIIFNKKTDQHLADEYQKKDDVLRIVVVPEQLPHMVQRLTYQVKENPDKGGMVSMAWEKLRIEFSVTPNGKN